MSAMDDETELDRRWWHIVCHNALESDSELKDYLSNAGLRSVARLARATHGTSQFERRMVQPSMDNAYWDLAEEEEYVKRLVAA